MGGIVGISATAVPTDRELVPTISDILMMVEIHGLTNLQAVQQLLLPTRGSYYIEA